MKIESKYNKGIEENIKSIRDKIYEREQIYIELASSARNDIEIMEIKIGMHNDSLLKKLYKQMQFIIERAVPTYYVTVENEEERELIEHYVK